MMLFRLKINLLIRFQVQGSGFRVERSRNPLFQPGDSVIVSEAERFMLDWIHLKWSQGTRKLAGFSSQFQVSSLESQVSGFKLQFLRIFGSKCMPLTASHFPKYRLRRI